jgi:hypothetical protein
MNKNIGSLNYQKSVCDREYNEQLVKVSLLAFAKNNQGQTIAEDAQDADPDEEDTLDPELSGLEDGVVDGKVLVAGVLLALLVLNLILQTRI